MRRLGRTLAGRAGRQRGRAAAEHGWSRKVLQAQIASDLRGRHGAALTSFDRALPAPDSELVRDAIKDPYNFEFLGLSADAKERDLPGLAAELAGITEAAHVIYDVEKP